MFMGEVGFVCREEVVGVGDFLVFEVFSPMPGDVSPEKAQFADRERGRCPKVGWIEVFPPAILRA